MAKFHIGCSGKAASCSAKKGNCPYGSDTEHYKTREEAQKAAEQNMSKQHKTLTSTNSKQKTANKDFKNNKVTSKIDKKTLQNFQSSFTSVIEIKEQYIKDNNLNYAINMMAASLANGEIDKANNYMSMLKSHIKDLSCDNDIDMYYMPGELPPLTLSLISGGFPHILVKKK